MSAKYDDYLNNHIMNVNRAYSWIRANLPEVWDLDPNGGFSALMHLNRHDESKFSREEYDAYDDYFYGPKSKEVEEKFNYAWLHHIHENPHHWQHWVLINDDPEEGSIGLDIPYKYVIEMICDWWSFSWNTGNLYEIFDWYDAHKKHMVLSENTRELVEQILGQIKEKLGEQNDISGGSLNG